MATNNFQMTLELKDQGDGRRVCHKPDGERFSQGQANTIKFNVTAKYAFTVTFRPQKMLKYWYIRGEKVEFERVKPKKDEEEVTMYETQWDSSGVEVTKRGERYSLPIEFELEPGVSLKTTLQTKFYPTLEITHSRWGQELHALDMSCAISDGQIVVDVLSEKLI